MSESAGGATVGGVLASATRALADSSPTGRLDAEILLGHVLGADRARLVLDRDVELEGEAHERFDRLVRRRLIGEPVAYLTGRRHFRALDLAVDRRVLIPRPETEHLVEAALQALPHGASVLDVGTGSGAIALALAAERPDLVIQAVDVSPDAITVATANRDALDLEVSFRVGDLLDGAPAVDAVLANLPYVARDERLPVDVAAFEPELALRAGADGLVVIRRLVAQLAAHAWPTWALLEIGATQGPAVATLLRAAGFPDVEIRPDLAGHDRVVVARRGDRRRDLVQAGSVQEAVGG